MHLGAPGRQRERDAFSIPKQGTLGTGLGSVLIRTSGFQACATWARWREADEALQREGMITTAQSGYQQVSPYYTIARKSLT